MTIAEKNEQYDNNNQLEILPTTPSRFSKKINELKEFSENLPKQSDLPRVPQSGGLFGWFNYDVKGSDLNNLTESIQEKMIKQNKYLVQTIQEFKNIYETFSILDKEYIGKILGSLKAAEEANNKALRGLAGVKENQAKIKLHQDDINNIIAHQKLVIQVLQKHKNKLDTIEHLEDVDEIFAAFSKLQSKFEMIELKFDNQELKFEDINENINLLLSSRLIFQDSLTQIKESIANQILTVKTLLSEQNEVIDKLEISISENLVSINNLEKEDVVNKNNFSEFKKIIQKDLQNTNENLTSSNIKFSKKIAEIIQELKQINTNFDNKIQFVSNEFEQETQSIQSYFETEFSKTHNVIDEQNLVIEHLSKQLKTTKLVSYSSISVIIMLLILIISGVM